MDKGIVGRINNFLSATALNSKNYKIRSGDLLYRKDERAQPYFAYLALSFLNIIPREFLPAFAFLFKAIRLKVRYRVLDRVLYQYPHSDIIDAKYMGGMPHEIRVSENFLRLAPANAVFYDIGSAVGWYSILLSKKCSKALAFDPENSSILENARLNNVNNINYYPYFISGATNEKNRRYSLDNLIYNKKFPIPDIVKMDIEGGEYQALLGAKRLFETTAPRLVLIETHSKEMFDKCLEFLKKFNYKIYNLGCPKVNAGGDIYPLKYDISNQEYSTASEGRILLATTD